MEQAVVRKCRLSRFDHPYCTVLLRFGRIHATSSHGKQQPERRCRSFAESKLARPRNPSPALAGTRCSRAFLSSNALLTYLCPFGTGWCICGCQDAGSLLGRDALGHCTCEWQPTSGGAPRPLRRTSLAILDCCRE